LVVGRFKIGAIAAIATIAAVLVVLSKSFTFAASADRKGQKSLAIYSPFWT
jgi:hypothetical protein